MRRFHWILVCCLLLTGPRAFALEFFGDVLYWQATEPVDWTMNTNRSLTNQIVAFKTLDYDFTPGFRVGVGVGQEHDWGAKLSYTRFYTETEDTVAGYVTPVFLGNRMATALLPQPHYFDNANIQATIDYNVLDLDFGKTFRPVRVAAIATGARPKRGLDQSELRHRLSIHVVEHFPTVNQRRAY